MAETHHWVALRYVEQKPCRAFLQKTPAQYRWSRAAAHLGEDKDRSGLLDMNFWEKAGGAATWQQMHASREGADEVLLLRRCTYAGRPFGGKEFVTQLEQHFQRSWRRRGFEKLAASA